MCEKGKLEMSHLTRLNFYVLRYKWYMCALTCHDMLFYTCKFLFPRPSHISFFVSFPTIILKRRDNKRETKRLFHLIIAENL